MNEKEINDILNDQKNAEVVDIFKYKEYYYIKAVRLDEKDIIYVYYKLDDNKNISEVKDKELLKHLKKTHEIHQKRIF